MILGNRRTVLHFDLAMVPFPEDAGAIPLSSLAPYLIQRSADGLAFDAIEHERRVIRLQEARQVDLPDGRSCLCLLFTLGDKDKALPGFTDFITGETRVVDAREDEGGALSVHAVVDLEPVKENGYIYRMIYEDVSGFGRSLIQSFLRKEFRIICSDVGFTYARPGKGNEVKTRPMVELQGHASETIKSSLQNGRLQSLELIRSHLMDYGFDEAKYFRTSRQNINISVSKDLPDGEALQFIEKVKVWAKRNDYDTMRVRWREPDKNRQQSAKLDTARSDAGEALFVRYEEIHLDVNLPDVSSQISDELINKMAGLLK